MEVKFSELSKKDVINITDGRHMGKVCDISFTFPENSVLGFTVTGCKGFRFSRQDVFVPIKSVVKIGKDAVLIKFGKEEPPANCEPPKPNCPPPCPPCPPPCPPPKNPPHGGYPQPRYDQPRRSLDEYE